MVAVREFRRRWNADRSSFSKLTLVLPETLRVGQVFQLGQQGTRAFYSRGASAFAGKGGRYSRGASGKLMIDAVEPHRIEISLDATFTLASPLDWPEECDVPIDIKRVIKADIADIAGLGAWEGGPSAEDSAFEEAHPSGR